jgi:predicted amidohydrolase
MDSVESMSRVITAVAMQFAVQMDVASNLDRVASLLSDCPDEALIVTPEGAISGYDPGPDFLSRLNPKAIEAAIEDIAALARHRTQCIVLGACVKRGETWRNASIVIRADGARSEYWKVNLARAEQGLFTPGVDLPVTPLELGGVSFKLAVQMCREIRHPEQWRHLAVHGAEVFAFVNNAVGDASIAPVWRSHLVSRAAELQRFVVAANNAAPDQKCPTMIIASDGGVRGEIAGPTAQCISARIDVDQVSNWVIGQSRGDIAFDR